MCGRYYVDDETARAIERLVTEVDKQLRQKRLGMDIRPTDPAPILEQDGGSLRMSWQRWGFPGYDGKQVIFNARAESVLDKRMFQAGIRHHRIVVPATWFYEWNRNKEKVTFLRQDSSVLYMAGFCSPFEDGHRFVILTTRANESMSTTHDRMPLILEPGELKDWIFDEGRTERILGQTPVLLKKKIEYEQQTLF
ncbi:MAG: SOS response-associated peptidase [Lachnospiraceae bacterium]